MTQPTLWREDLPPELSKLLWIHQFGHNAYSPGVTAEMMQAYNQTLMDVARERGVDCIDLASQLPKDSTIFYDDAHFNINRCERVVEIVARFFAAKYAQR